MIAAAAVWWSIAAAIAAFLAYEGASSSTVVSSDLITHVYLAYSMVWQGDARLDEYFGPGAVQFRYFILNGNAYAPYLPGNAVLFAPVAFVAGLLGADPSWPDLSIGWSKHIAAASVAVSVGAVLGTLMQFLALRPALYLTLAYALATPAFSVASQLYWEHGPSLAFISLALFLVLRGERAGSGGAVAGLALGMAVLVRPMNAFLGLATLAFFVHRRRRAAARFVLWAIGPALFLAIYDTVVLGSPFRTPRTTFEVPGGSSLLEGAVGQLASPSRGLLVYTPFLAFALLTLGRIWRGKTDERTWLLRYGSFAALSTFALFSWYSYWWGGHSYGNRYISDLLPVYALALGEAWHRGWLAGPGARAAFAASVGWALLLHTVGATVWYRVGYIWDAIPDIDEAPWRLWSWTDAQWQFSLANLLARPDLALPAAALILALLTVVLVAGPLLDRLAKAGRVATAASP